MATWRTLPTFPGEPRWTMTIGLSGVDFRLSFDWHDREQRWFMDIARATGEPIASGIKVVENWGLLRKVASRLRPPGELAAFASGGGPPLIHDFGTRVTLLYGVP